MFNTLQLVIYAGLFGANSLFSDEKPTIYQTSEFESMFNNDLSAVVDDVSHNSNQAAYDAAKSKTVADAVEAVKILKQDYSNGSKYNNLPDYVVDSSIDGSNIMLTVKVADQNINENVQFYTDYQNSEENMISDFNTSFGDYVYNIYCHNTNEAGESSSLNLQNISYYAEYTDGSTAGNVENPQEFINNLKSGGNEYLILNGAEYDSSSNLKDFSLYTDFYNNTLKNTKLYVSVDSSFSKTDKYAVLNRSIESIKNTNINLSVAVLTVSFIGIVIFAVISVRLAGHKNGEIKTAFIDKIPADLHLAVSAAVFAALLWLVLQFLNLRFRFNFYADDYNSVPDFFVQSSLRYVFETASGALIYLVIIEFTASAARNIKAGNNIFKSSVIYGILHLCFRFVKSVFSFLKKRFVNLLDLFNIMAFESKKLDRRITLAVIAYTLINIALCFFSLIFGWGAAIIIIALLVFDAFVVYKVLKYIKALDMIIIKTEKNEPLDVDINTLPESLKTLAHSLDYKNAQLQQAVIKAVKDERTKTELITNVSHDLKTPLTSVINYIDLLKKCDIKDETARKYMNVIDEKSNKLKRLIEDLIEASKVSSGNVTINKTKLNLNELAAQAVVEETSDIEKRGLHIIFEESDLKHIVFADGTKIYRVFENLLSNARKYSAPGSRIYARVYSDDKYGYFELKNISKEQLNIDSAELMERFVRGDKSRNEEGNGLGLSIAKELCKLNGGELIINIDGDLFKATVKLPKEQEK
ncbi:MAG: HAMP domain-containing histidine kinase [Clostridiales bacterium]|nr:HAMP domain-containing histidine kinase [Clostridiales bacterium]